jgi:hypothetical protein
MGAEQSECWRLLIVFHHVVKELVRHWTTWSFIFWCCVLCSVSVTGSAACPVRDTLASPPTLSAFATSPYNARVRRTSETRLAKYMRVLRTMSAAQDVVAKAANTGEYTWIATDARVIFLECDVARVCHLGGAAPEADLGTSMQDLAGGTDDTLDQVLPFAVGNCAGRAEYVNGPGLTPIACFGDGRVTAGWIATGVGSFDILH